MDAVELARKLQEEATCSICLDYFTDPVMTTCGHNFCRECIQTSWEKAKGKKGRKKQKGSFPCPECREVSPQRNLRPNRLLTKVAEMARQHPGLHKRDLCLVHQEPLKLFCQEDQVPICVVCREAREHRTHRVLPVEEAVQEYKLKLEEDMRYLREEVTKTQKLQAQEEQTSAEWQDRVKERRQRIVVEFEKVALFLVEEERRLLQALKEEEEETAARLRDSKACLDQQGHALDLLLLQLEDRSQREPLQMLQQYHAFVSGSSISPRRPRVSQDSLQHAALLSWGAGQSGHEGCPGQVRSAVQCRWWRRWAREAFAWAQRGQRVCVHWRKNNLSMQYPEVALPTELKTVCRVPGQIEILKGFQEDVLPDPSSAYPYLLLYESRQRRYLSHLPDSSAPQGKDRFMAYPCAVGQKSFSSGRHYWEVGMNLTGDALWALGVCRDNVSRKDRVPKSPENGFWVVQLSKGKKPLSTVPTPVPVTLVEPPSYMGIFLDFEAGEVSFYSVNDGSHLHTYSEVTFPGPLQPFFCLGAPKSGQMVISTVTLWVKG